MPPIDVFPIRAEKPRVKLTDFRIFETKGAKSERAENPRSETKIAKTLTQSQIIQFVDRGRDWRSTCEIIKQLNNKREIRARFGFRLCCGTGALAFVLRSNRLNR